MQQHERMLAMMPPSGDAGRASTADAEVAHLKSLRDARVRALLVRRSARGAPRRQPGQVQ